MILNRFSALALVLASGLLLTGCATRIEKDSAAPTTPPSATITVTEWSAAYDGAAAMGQGTVTFEGLTSNFSVSSVGVGGTGAQKVTATGYVYNLRSLADFAGTYTGVRTGLTLVQGTLHEKLTNKNGTIIYLTGHTQGLASSTGVDEIIITLKKP